MTMANRIGDFFQTTPDRREAKDGIALHIKKFWDPRMRRELIASLDTDGAAGMSSLVREAILEKRAELLPTQ